MVSKDIKLRNIKITNQDLIDENITQESIKIAHHKAIIQIIFLYFVLIICIIITLFLLYKFFILKQWQEKMIMLIFNSIDGILISAITFFKLKKD